MTALVGKRMDEHEARGRALVHVLAFVLDKMVLSNSDEPQENYPITKFHALRPPGIPIEDYLLRILKYASCSPECFVLSLVYIDRLIQRNDNIILTQLNVHRIVITSIVLAAKFFDDQYFNNAYYAKIGGVPCAEMNSLELEFLFLTNFSLHVSTESYERYYNELANHPVFMNAMFGSAGMNTSGKVRHFVTADPHCDNLVYVTQHEEDQSMKENRVMRNNNFCRDAHPMERRPVMANPNMVPVQQPHLDNRAPMHMNQHVPVQNNQGHMPVQPAHANVPTHVASGMNSMPIPVAPKRSQNNTGMWPNVPGSNGPRRSSRRLSRGGMPLAVDARM